MAKKSKKIKDPAVPQVADETRLQRTIRARQLISEYVESNFNELVQLRSATLAVHTISEALGIVDNNLMVEMAHSAWVEAVSCRQTKVATLKDTVRSGGGKPAQDRGKPAQDVDKLISHLEQEAILTIKDTEATIKVFSEALEKALLDPAPTPPSLVERVYIRCKRIWAAMKS